MRGSRHLLATCLTFAFLALTAATAIAVEPPVDGPIVRGTVVDPDGQPATAFAATMQQFDSASEAQYAATFEVVDGAFEFVAQPWGTIDAPSSLAILVLLGPEVADTDADGCTTTSQPAAQGSLDVIAGADPAPIVLYAGLVEGGVCAAPTASPTRPAPGASTTWRPRYTLPPTDSVAGVDSQRTVGMPGLVSAAFPLLGVVLAAALVVQACRSAARIRR